MRVSSQTGDINLGKVKASCIKLQGSDWRRRKKKIEPMFATFKHLKFKKKRDC